MEITKSRRWAPAKSGRKRQKKGNFSYQNERTKKKAMAVIQSAQQPRGELTYKKNGVLGTPLGAPRSCFRGTYSYITHYTCKNVVHCSLKCIFVSIISWSAGYAQTSQIFIQGSLRNKHFHGVGEQRKTDERNFRCFAHVSFKLSHSI